MSQDLILGILALAFGLFTLVLRFVAPGSKLFSKIDAIKERFGDTAGTAIHWFAYTIVPLVLGILLILSSQAG